MILAWLLLPFYIWELNKDRKPNTPFVWVKLLHFRNYLTGFSCAEIEAVLWIYGIPTHLLDVQVTNKEKKKFIDNLIFVPSNRAYWADVILRQNANKMGYEVLSKPIGNSRDYRDKQYRRWGIESKQKGILAKFEHWIFGNLISYKHIKDLPKVEKGMNKK